MACLVSAACKAVGAGIGGQDVCNPEPVRFSIRIKVSPPPPNGVLRTA